MSIASVSSSNVTTVVAATATVVDKSVNATQQEGLTKVEMTSSTIKPTENKQEANQTGAEQQQPNEAEVKNVTDELNNFMQSMNTDINFVLHTKTDTLIIQVADGKTHKVIKEFPAHELLDMVARLRDSVGAFLDKKA